MEESYCDAQARIQALNGAADGDVGIKFVFIMGAGNILPVVTPFHELVPCQPIFKILRSAMSEIHVCRVSYEFRNFMVDIERLKQSSAPEEFLNASKTRSWSLKSGAPT